MADLDGFKVGFDGYTDGLPSSIDGYTPAFDGYGDGLPTSFGATDYTTLIQGEAVAAALTVSYHQRVYDVGGAQFVYYTKASVDPAPSAGETIPNHSGGSLTNHSVLTVIPQ